MYGDSGAVQHEVPIWSNGSDLVVLLCLCQ